MIEQWGQPGLGETLSLNAVTLNYFGARFRVGPRFSAIDAHGEGFSIRISAEVMVFAILTSEFAPIIFMSGIFAVQGLP